jgi:hypothetical protein
MFKSLFTTAALLAVASLQSADAHSMMTLPKPNSNINNSPSGTIDGPSIMPPPAGKGYGTSPDANTAAFLEAFKAQSKFKSIRDIVYAGFKPDGASTKECGQSAATGPPQPLPDAVEYGGGFDSSHEGPCEVWCDDTRVFYEDNCSKKYTSKPAKLPYDKSKCAGAKRLQSFWLALHVPAWQAYIACSTLSGGGGGGGAAPAPAPAGGSGGGNGGNGGGNGGGNSGNEAPAPNPAPAPAPAPAPRPNPAPAPAPAGKCTPKRFRRD